MLKCPKCKRIVMDRASDGAYKVRTRMLLLSEVGATAICPSCKEHVPVPIVLDTSKPPTTQGDVMHFVQIKINK